MVAPDASLQLHQSGWYTCMLRTLPSPLRRRPHFSMSPYSSMSAMPRSSRTALASASSSARRAGLAWGAGSGWKASAGAMRCPGGAGPSSLPAASVAAPRCLCLRRAAQPLHDGRAQALLRDGLEEILLLAVPLAQQREQLVPPRLGVVARPRHGDVAPRHARRRGL